MWVEREVVVRLTAWTTERLVVGRPSSWVGAVQTISGPEDSPPSLEYLSE